MEVKKLSRTRIFRLLAVTAGIILLTTVLAGAAGAGERITNGNFGSSTGWTSWTERGSITRDFNSSTGVPSGGSAPCLRFRNGNNFNGGVWQEITLVGGQSYTLSGVFRDYGGSSTWAEVLIAESAPVNGSDFGSGLMVKSDTWSCDNWNHAFSSGCVSSTTTYNCGGSGVQTRYIVLKVGMGGSIDTTFDSVSLVGPDPCTPPSITSHPSSQTKTAGQTATFTVTATGDAPLSYQWQVMPSGGSWANVTGGSGGTTASYTTATLSLSDNQNQYRCQVTNSCGSVDSNAATLTVACPYNDELLTNGSFDSDCTGWSHSENTGYWGCGEKAYSGGGGYSWNGWIACGGSSWCNVDFAAEQHQDDVMVKAGACYAASAWVYYESVAHDGDPTDQKERIVLTFNDPGTTTHSSAWHTHVNDDSWDLITLAGNVPAGATSMTFKVELQDTDNQWSGTAGIDECSFLSEIPNPPPTITGHPSDQCGAAGGTATFTVTATGDGTLTYQWQMKPVGGSWAEVTGATSASYTTPTLTTDDAGNQYRCNVSNAYGTATSNAATLALPNAVCSGTVNKLVDSTGVARLSAGDVDGGSTPGDISLYLTEQGSTTIDSYVVENDITSIRVMSLVDDNDIYLNDVLQASLDHGDYVDLSVDADDKISGAGPYCSDYVGGADKQNSTLVPKAFAGYKFAVYAQRDTPKLSMLALEPPANVTIYENGLTSVKQSLTVNPTAESVALTNGNKYVVVSDSPILLHYQGAGSNDAAPVPAASTELYGVPSGSAFVVMAENNTSVTYYRSDGSSTGPDTYNVGDVVSISGGSQGNSSGVRVVADKPVNVQSHADADGGDMTAFYPKWALARGFIIPRSAEYCVIVPEESGATITVANSGTSSGVSDGTYGGGGTESSPGFKHFGSTTSVSGSIAAGTTFYCDVPAFCYYEPDDDDEGNLNGDMSAILLEADESTTATLHAVHRYGCEDTCTSTVTAIAPDTTPPSMTSITPSSTCVKTGDSISMTANVSDSGTGVVLGDIWVWNGNLLTNPSFETGTTSSWTGDLNGIGNSYPTPGTPKDGSYWVGSSCAYSSGLRTPELRQTASVTPGQAYDLSVWAHTDGSPNTCSSFLQWYDGADPGSNGQCTTLDSFTSNTSGWQQLSGTVTPSGDQLTICLRLSWDCSGSGGGGNFDFAKVIAKDTPDTYADNVATWNSLTIGASGPITVYAKDGAGNEASADSPSITTDDAAPSGTIEIASGSDYTSTTSVQLTLSATDSGCAEIGQMRFSNDEASWSGWEAYSTSKSWTLASGDGVKTVYVQYRDTLQNASSSFTDTITLDTTEPSFTDIAADPSSAGTDDVVTITFTASEPLDEDPSVTVNGNAASYVSNASLDYTYSYTVLGSDPDGPATISITGNDLAGNEGSSSSTTALMIVSDSTPPNITNITPSSTCVKTGDSISMTADVSDSGTGVVLGDICCSTPWEAFRSDNLLVNPSAESGNDNWTVGGNGVSNTGGVFVPTPAYHTGSKKWVKDIDNGSFSSHVYQQVAVTANETYQIGVYAHANAGSTGYGRVRLVWIDGAHGGTETELGQVASPGWTAISGFVRPTSSTITVKIYLEGEGVSYQYAAAHADDAYVYLCSAPDTYVSDTATWNSLTIEGSGALTVHAKDGTGNEASADSPSITTDDAAPNTFTPAADPDDWTSGNVDVIFSTTDVGCAGVDHYMVAIDTGSYSPAVSPFTVTAEGAHTVHVKAVDALGSETAPMDVTTYIDRTNPSGTITINGGDTYATSTSVTLTLSASDGLSGVAQMQFSNDEASWSGWEAYSTSKSWTLASGDGVKTVYVQYKDNAGNVSANASDTITLDTTHPTCTVSGPASPTNQSPITFTIEFSEDVTGLEASDIAVTNGTKGTLSGSGTSYSLPVTPTDQGAVTCQVPADSASDAAGNGNTASNTASVVYDSEPPTAAITAPSVAATTTGPVTYTITYTGADSVTLDASDVTLNGTGTASGDVAVSGSGTSERTVTISNITGDGTLGISISAGTASDAAGNTAPAAGPSDTFSVDNSAPYVVDVTSTNADGTYGTDDTIYIQIQFSEVVNASGAIDLELETGDVDQVAVYTGGTGTDTLTFEYTVVQGDASADLDYQATDSLVLNTGAVIEDALGTDADTTLPEPGTAGSLGDNKDIVIQTCIPPVITSDPIGDDICPGGSHEMFVTATGTPPLSYQWKKGGTDIPGAQSSSYTATDAGSYTCTVSNACGSDTSNAAVVSFKAATTITQHPVGGDICSGNSIVLSVTATGEGDLSYQWKKDTVDISGATSSSYEATEAGSYTCVVAADCGSVESNAAVVSFKAATTITQHPVGNAICQGNSHTMTVTATGAGAVSYQWKKDSVDISGATSSSYEATEEGSYTCVVAADCGSVESNAAVVSFKAATTITQHPVGGDICSGNSIVLSVTATGAGDVSYQWKKDTVDISGAMSSSYTATEEGSYTCVVTADCGSVESNAAVVSFKAATTITQHPLGGDICSGNSIVLSVTATGEGDLSYQWKKDTVDISGATSSSYTATEEGSYTCVVTADCGSVESNAAVVSFKAATTITQQPVGNAICQGSSHMMTVVATGAGAVSYQWRKDTVDISGATSSSYEATEEGSYTCVVAADCGSVESNAAVVSFKAATEITTHPVGGDICSGDSIVLSVTATGEGTLTYQWKKDTVDISGATSASYEATDEGSYTCVVAADCGSVESNAAVVQVGAHPTVDSITPSTTGPTNADSVDFTVVFSEGVTDFDDESDVTVNHSGTSHSAISFTANSAANYTVTVSGIADDGTLSLSVNADGAQSTFAGCSSEAAGPSADVTIDNSAPASAANPAGGLYNADQSVTLSADETAAIYYTTDGSEPTTASSLYSAAIVISETTTLKFFAVDTAGNPEAINTEEYEIDKVAPTVTVEQAAAQDDPTAASPIEFTVTFSEPVTGFEPADVVLGGTAGATTINVTGTGADYQVSASGMTSDGTVTASIPADAVQDAAGNLNLASTSTDNTVTYDTTDPVITITSIQQSGLEMIDPSDYAANQGQVTITFTVAEPNLDGMPVLMVGDSQTEVIAVGAVTALGGDQYQAEAAITPTTANGLATATVTAVDLAGNSDQATAQFDVNKIQLDVTVQLAGGHAASINRCVTFSLGNSLGAYPYQVNQVVTFAASEAQVTLANVPYGFTWTCLGVKDVLHTLRTTVDLVDVGNEQYEVLNGNPVVLLEGDLTNDNLVDILDFGAFVGQYGWTLGPVDCAYVGRHADFSGEGLVNTADFTFIHDSFLTFGDGCCPGIDESPEYGPRSSITVQQLQMSGIENAVMADFNRDGIVDQTDIVLFLQATSRRGR